MRPDHGLDEALALVRRLNFSRAGSVDDAFPSDWGLLVRELLDARSTYGPMPASDPIALLASASRAAQRTAPLTGPEAGYRLVADAIARHQSDDSSSVGDLRDLYRRGAPLRHRHRLTVWAARTSPVLRRDALRSAS